MGSHELGSAASAHTQLLQQSGVLLNPVPSRHPSVAPLLTRVHPPGWPAFHLVTDAPKACPEVAARSVSAGGHTLSLGVSLSHLTKPIPAGAWHRVPSLECCHGPGLPSPARTSLHDIRLGMRWSLLEDQPGTQGPPPPGSSKAHVATAWAVTLMPLPPCTRGCGCPARPLWDWPASALVLMIHDELGP